MQSVPEQIHLQNLFWSNSSFRKSLVEGNQTSEALKSDDNIYDLYKHNLVEEGKLEGIFRQSDMNKE